MLGHGVYPGAICTVLGKAVWHRTSATLNNRFEQDHRGTKGRIRHMCGFKSHDATGRFRFTRSARAALGIRQSA